MIPHRQYACSLSTFFMSYFPAGASFFTTHFASASWFCHLFLRKRTKNLCSKILWSLENIWYYNVKVKKVKRAIFFASDFCRFILGVQKWFNAKIVNFARLEVSTVAGQDFQVYAAWNWGYGRIRPLEARRRGRREGERCLKGAEVNRTCWVGNSVGFFHLCNKSIPDAVFIYVKSAWIWQTATI